jgi:hypothetical protein
MALVACLAGGACTVVRNRPRHGVWKRRRARERAYRAGKRQTSCSPGGSEPSVKAPPSRLPTRYAISLSAICTAFNAAPFSN